MKKHILWIALLIAAVSANAQNKPAQKPMSNIKKGFVHTVYFWLKEPNNQTAKDSLYQGLQLLSSIKEIREGYIGTPAETRRPVIDHTYAYSITFVFKNKADQDIYQEHPTHKKFIELYSHLWERVQVYDAVGL
ncbi:MAG: Dabb family protein [Cytophagales bacterium]|nr:Dabb family protein [Cytophagales bacterium]